MLLSSWAQHRWWEIVGCHTAALRSDTGIEPFSWQWCPRNICIFLSGFSLSWWVKRKHSYHHFLMVGAGGLNRFVSSLTLQVPLWVTSDKSFTLWRFYLLGTCWLEIKEGLLNYQRMKRNSGSIVICSWYFLKQKPSLLKSWKLQCSDSVHFSILWQHREELAQVALSLETLAAPSGSQSPSSLTLGVHCRGVGQDGL